MWRLKGLGCFNPPYAINRFGGSRFANAQSTIPLEFINERKILKCIIFFNRKRIISKIKYFVKK